MLISRKGPGPKGADRPVVTVTTCGKYQFRIIFNAVLMHGFDLRSSRVAIDWDEANTLTFIMNVGDLYGGGQTFSLGFDGGNKKSAARAVHISISQMPLLKLGKYEPSLGEMIGGDDNLKKWPAFEGMRHPTISINVNQGASVSS